ncbi:MAG: lipoate--protein ligase family protein [Anaerolineae bacterium]
MGSELPAGYPPATWRLLVDGEADGATNMAFDQAILEAVAEGASLPTLRFYAWAPPCLSLGRGQPLADADQDACRGAGVEIVRRPTGGRSILHTDELTYSVSLLQSDPRAEGGVVESYRRLSEGLLAGLHRLGVQVAQSVSRGLDSAEDSAVCFETPADYEITADGRKLVGSAQWRTRGGVLQHGTLPLYGDLTRIVDYVVVPDAERGAQRRYLQLQALTLEEARGQRVSFAAATQALIAGFAQALDLTLLPGELTSSERARSAEIRANVYASPDWTARL